MMNTQPDLISQIEGYLAVSGTSATAFGWEVLGDPKFVHDLRNGRKVRDVTRQKVLDHIRRFERRTKRASQ